MGSVARQYQCETFTDLGTDEIVPRLPAQEGTAGEVTDLYLAMDDHLGCVVARYELTFADETTLTLQLPGVVFNPDTETEEEMVIELCSFGVPPETAKGVIERYLDKLEIDEE